MSVYLTGYLVWRETVSTMVPLSHEVMNNKKPKVKTKKKNKVRLILTIVI